MLSAGPGVIRHSHRCNGPGVTVHRVEPEIHHVRVRVREQETTAELLLSVTTDPGERRMRLSIRCELGEWSGHGEDIFSALRSLMRDLEHDCGRIGVEGARPNAWASGMQRDMGVGRSVYILSLPRSPERPPSAQTLDPAPLDEVGTTADQDEFQRLWMPSSNEL